jgi:hypothetical protein
VFDKLSVAGGSVSTPPRSSSQLPHPGFTSHDQPFLEPGTATGATLSISGIEPGDRELIHYYYHSTSVSITDVANRPIQQEVAPCEAVSHPWALLALLSFTVLHIAYLVPSRRQSSYLLAMKHQARAITLFNESVTKINERNSDCLVLFSSLWTFSRLSKLSLEHEKNGTNTIDDLLLVYPIFGRMVTLWGSCSHLVRNAKIARLLKVTQNGFRYSSCISCVHCTR